MWVLLHCDAVHVVSGVAWWVLSGGRWMTAATVHAL